MNADQMMKIIGEAREDYVQSAWESKNQTRRRSPLSFVSKVAVVAAIMISLTVTAYASDVLGVKTLHSGGFVKKYSSFEKLDKAEKAAGFEIDLVEEFDSGYVFQDMSVSTTKGLDENREEKLRYQEINVNFRNEAGHTLYFWAQQDLEELPDTPSPVAESRQIGDITVEYRVDNYKHLPAEREGNLTEEEKRWQEQPGNYISYFSWEAEASEEKVAFLSWEKDGICYRFMDRDADESTDTLFAMAGELIEG